MDKTMHLKFCMQTNYDQFFYLHQNLPILRSMLGYYDLFNIVEPLISLEWLKLNASYLIQRCITVCI